MNFLAYSTCEITTMCFRYVSQPRKSEHLTIAQYETITMIAVLSGALSSMTPHLDVHITKLFKDHKNELWNNGMMTGAKSNTKGGTASLMCCLIESWFKSVWDY